MAAVIVSFATAGTADIYDGRDSRLARRTCPPDLWGIARRKLDQINRVPVLGDLAVPPGNRLEALRGTRRVKHSIRIIDQYRVCFRWERGQAHNVEITDYH